MQILAGAIETENNQVEVDIWEQIIVQAKNIDGIMGYRIPSLGFITNDEIPTIIIRSCHYGIILIEIFCDELISVNENGEIWTSKSEKRYYSRDTMLSIFREELESRLKKDIRLYDFRRKKFKNCSFSAYTFFPLNSKESIKTILSQKEEVSFLNEIVTNEDISNFISKKLFPKDRTDLINSSDMDLIDSLLEGTNSYQKALPNLNEDEKPRKLNDFIVKSLDQTFKLDEVQRQIALQIPEGPQRIRGLAGTGKTVILCLKAALAHKLYPNYRILFLFNTQSMYNQIKKYITDYYVRETKRTPTDNIEILHAWGGRGKTGLYSRISDLYGIKARTYFEVRGHSDPLEFIFQEMLQQLKNVEPIYDLVLIDEAQDFSPALFEMVYHLTKAPKRIVWAYDEFQSLRELKIKEPEELFGLNSEKKPNVSNSSLNGVYKGEIKKDFILPNSYRNPRVVLMVAHGIGMSLYNSNDILPIEDRSSWEARGYNVIEPLLRSKFQYKDRVIVERPNKNSKNILEDILIKNNHDEKDLINYSVFSTIEEELEYLTNKVHQLIVNESVEPEEIIIINLETKNSEQEFQIIRQRLDRRNIKSITPGFIENADQFKEPGAVTLTTTFRAKGNEANIVFVLNCQNIINNSTYRVRNAFFVSVTRSRGWCFLSGHGDDSRILKREIDLILEHYPKFNFIFPAIEEVKRRLRILSSSKELDKVESKIDEILKDGDLTSLLLEKISKNPEIMNRLKTSLRSDNED